MKSGGQISWNAVAICENVQDFLADGKTPYERRFGESLKGPIIPFGALVEYLPNSARHQARIHQFRKHLIAERIWKGDILIADVEKLENLDASEICPGRLNVKEVLITQRNEEFVFLVADGSANYQEETTNSRKCGKAEAPEAKTRFSCIAEAHESTRPGIESVTKRSHEDHIAGKGQNSVLHHNPVHKFIPMHQAMKIRMQRLQWTRNGKSLRQFQRGNWTQSKAKRRFLKRR